MTLDEIHALKTGDRLRLSNGRLVIYRGKGNELHEVKLEFPPMRAILTRSIEELMHGHARKVEP